jgi:DNA repair exonuclease SbcCD nuclease subunit
MKPYAIVSDIHCHNWSAFATTLPDGMNSRLKITLDDLRRAAIELRDAGGDTLYVAGDIFHSRGSIDPEVFNPTHDAFKEIAEDSITVRMIPGNHDLKGRDTTELGNAIQTLGAIEGIEIVTEKVGRRFDDGDSKILMLPWHATKADLRATIADIVSAYPPELLAEVDLIIHVGIDGVLAGVPDSGLSTSEVASWGFKRVFAGDYHAHKVMEDGKVISIGASTQQQWGDIGTKAGFLLVYPDRIDFRASHAPSFIELTGDTDPDDYELLVDGNYVRIRGMKLTDPEIKKFRTELEKMGARGVNFQITREVVAARGSSTVAKASTLDESVDKFVETLTVTDPAHVALIKAGAADVLSTVRSVAA